MREVIWVCGSSAAGKATFIKTVTKHPNLDVVERLGWAGRQLSKCQESLDIIGQYDEDPNIRLRRKILEEVPELLKGSDVVLIKWQLVDSKIDLPKELKRITPQAKHKVVLLQTPAAELAYRLVQKKWWHSHQPPEDYIAEEQKQINKYLNKMARDFEITTVDSSQNGRYEILV